VAYNIFGQGGGEKVAERMGVPYLGAVPLDPNVPPSSDHGEPLVLAHPDSPAAQALRKIAQDLAAKISVQTMNRPEERFAADPDLAVL
jgi:ATP-binding protein involved in chromosome partitioning